MFLGMTGCGFDCLLCCGYLMLFCIVCVAVGCVVMLLLFIIDCYWWENCLYVLFMVVYDCYFTFTGVWIVLDDLLLLDGLVGF